MTRYALFALAFAAALPALATPAPADITGAWAFATQAYGNGCKLSGSLVLKGSGKTYSCSMAVQERCNDIAVKARESCVATRTGDGLVIKATVQSVDPVVGYVPDDFELKIQSSAYMKGMLRSFHSAPVDFYRGDAPVS
ncbi:MAG TPA: hypothetical protein VG983_00705 [Caulobacterales bacterium]|nr:hypothetical protein [Caulobacterales bacterium]